MSSASGKLLDNEKQKRVINRRKKMKTVMRKNIFLCILVAVVIYIFSNIVLYGFYYEVPIDLLSVTDYITIIPFGLKHLFEIINSSADVLDKVCEIIIHAAGILGILVAILSKSFVDAAKNAAIISLMAHVIVFAIGLIGAFSRMDFGSVLFLLAALLVIGGAGGQFIILIFGE